MSCVVEKNQLVGLFVRFSDVDLSHHRLQGGRVFSVTPFMGDDDLKCHAVCVATSVAATLASRLVGHVY